MKGLVSADIPAITLGAGRNRPQGQRVELTGHPVRALADIISAHVGTEAWWSVCTFNTDYRKGEKWCTAIAVAIDLDYHDEDGKHAAIPPDVAARAVEALGELPNVIHDTPRGLRVVLVLGSLITDLVTFASAGRGAVHLVGRALGVLIRECGGLRIDPTVTKDRARFVYTPCATVDGVERHGEVRVMRLEPWPVEFLVSHDPGDLRSAAVYVGQKGNGRATPMPENAKRASAYLAKIQGAVSGNGGHDQTWSAALAVVRGFSLTPEVAFDLLAREYNPRCTPPWTEKELRHKVEDASKASIAEGYLLQEQHESNGNGHTRPISNGSGSDRASIEEDADAPLDLGPKTVQDLLKLAETAGKVEVIPSVLPGLPDGVGHAAGRITVVGAFTGGGKTSLCVAEGVHLASLGHPVVIVTAELSEIEYARRILQACDGDVGALRISVLEARGDIHAVIGQVSTWAEPLDGGKAPAVIVDYLQRLRVDGASSREREVAEVAEQLQTTSRRLGVIVVAAAQLNRNSQSETRPALHHFRESGLIEQVADLALLIGQTAPDRMYAIVAKNRWGGGAGTEVEFSADFARCRFGLLDRREVLEPLAGRVVEYVTAHGGRGKLSEISSDIKIPGTKRHPKTTDIVEAGLATKAYVINAGIVSLP